MWRAQLLTARHGTTTARGPKHVTVTGLPGLSEALVSESLLGVRRQSRPSSRTSWAPGPQGGASHQALGAGGQAGTHQDSPLYQMECPRIPGVLRVLENP